jgi:hypothetical protein
MDAPAGSTPRCSGGPPLPQAQADPSFPWDYGGSEDRDEYSALGITIRVLSTILAIIIIFNNWTKKKETP